MKTVSNVNYLQKDFTKLQTQQFRQLFLFLFRYWKKEFAYRIRTPYCLLGIISLKGVELLQRSLHAQDIPIRHSSHIHNGEIMETRQLIRTESRGASRKEWKTDTRSNEQFSRCYFVSHLATNAYKKSSSILIMQLAVREPI